jgi:hypothetical protein
VRTIEHDGLEIGPRFPELRFRAWSNKAIATPSSVRLSAALIAKVGALDCFARTGVMRDQSPAGIAQVGVANCFTRL